MKLYFKNTLKLVVGIVISAGMVILILFVNKEGQKEREKEHEMEAPVNVQSRVEIKDGITTVVLDTSTLEAGGIVAEKVKCGIEGAIVPLESVIWFDGKPYVYIETEKNRFTRKKITLDKPVDDSWSIGRELPENTFIVTTGAEVLLSEEFRSQIYVSKD